MHTSSIASPYTTRSRAQSHLPRRRAFTRPPSSSFSGSRSRTARDLPPSLLRALPSAGYDQRAYAVRPATVTQVLRDGDLLDLGGTTLRVLHLPGHSPGSIALWDAARERLFTGDVIYEGELLDEMNGTDIEAYIASMRRLLELPVEVVYPGHGQPFGGRRLREIASDYIARRTSG